MLLTFLVGFPSIIDTSKGRIHTQIPGSPGSFSFSSWSENISKDPSYPIVPQQQQLEKPQTFYSLACKKTYPSKVFALCKNR
jgi:hypothetical protein